MSRHQEILAKVRLGFPQPTSDPIHDAYFSHLVHHALDRIDDMKDDAPFLGRRGQVDYARAQQAALPEQMGALEQVIEEVAGYLEGIPIWGHPRTQENVVPPTTIPSIVGLMAAAIYNPNVIWDEYSHRVAEAEVEATAMVARLIGYDPAQAGGVFTFGGTGTNLYGVKVGLSKALPSAMRSGVREDVAIICSDASHYSKLNVAGWLGIGADNVVEIPTDSHNGMIAQYLAETLDELIGSGQRIAAIIATMGTTDAFGIDPLADIRALRDQIAAERGLDYLPHIHADAVIGWPWAVFNDYDFAANPLGFGARTVRSLRNTREQIQRLHLADSVGVDFHKTGYAPYASSLFLLRDRADFDLLTRDQAKMPYLYQFGEYHPGVYTLESSRNGGAILAALGSLKLLGKEGYRAILGQIVTMAERLREALDGQRSMVVVNDYNHGPVTLFRVYPPGTFAGDAYRAETADARGQRDLQRHNAYCRRVFDATHGDVLSGRGVNLSITDCYRKTASGAPIAALKSFVMSPFTDEATMDLVVERVLEGQRRLGRTSRAPGAQEPDT